MAADKAHDSLVQAARTAGALRMQHGISVFLEVRFWILMLGSVVLPFGIYALLMLKRAISPRTVLLLGFALILIAGFDVYVLQKLSQAVGRTASRLDDAMFASEVSVALYLLPALFAGLGINIVSNVLNRHLEAAERRFAQEQQGREQASAD